MRKFAVWADFESTYVGPDIEDIWAALFRSTNLFRRVAKEVGDALGYTYPQLLDNKVSAYLDAVRKLPRGVEPTRSEDDKT
jgi:aminoglycoside 6-adenylyltransferase